MISFGGLVAGQTSRIPGDWLRFRHDWLDLSGKPLLPDWMLCSSAGLQGQERLAGELPSADDKDSLVLAYRAVEDSLQITQEIYDNHKHPDVRAMMSETDVELYNMFKKSEKKAAASKKASAKNTLLSEARADDLKRLQDELRCEKSTSEAFTALVPGVRGKSAAQKGKLSVAKAKAKATLSLKGKFAGKVAKKIKGGTEPPPEPIKDAGASAGKLVETSHKPVEDSVHKPVEGHLFKKKVRFIDESHHLYGREATVLSHVGGKIQILESGVGAGSFPENSVEDLSDAVEHAGWKNLGSLKKQEKYWMLIDLGVWENPEHPDDDLEPVFVTDDKSTFIPHSALVQGACLLQHCFPNDQAFIVDPLCSSTWWNFRSLEVDSLVPSHIAQEHLEHSQGVQKRISGFLRQKFEDEKVQVMYFPVFSPHHWTLLVVEKEPSLRARYWDSLPDPKKGSFETAQALVRDCLGLDIELPSRHNYARQTEPTCGFFTLSFMEEDWRKRLKHGSASQGQSHLRNVKSWKQKLKKLGTALESERAKLLQEREKAEEKAGCNIRKSCGLPCGALGAPRSS